MLKNIARIVAVGLVAVAGLVACSDDQQACAAQGAPLPQAQQTYRPPAPRPPKQPTQKRTTSKVQDKPRATTKIQPTQKPTSWSGYNDRVKKRNWSQPYRKGYAVPQQPVIVNYYGHDYRTYYGYPGYYPIGVWPMGYGAHYGCVADEESTPEAAPASTPTPAPAATVTVTPSTTPSPTETPR
jgi:hypothetical protein